jgi:lysyl endopeptidase
MKKKLLSVFVFSLALFCNTADAQLSQGGMPVCFGKHFSETKTMKFQILPAINIAALQAEDAVNDQSKGPFRFGFNHLVNYNLTNSGSWTTLSNGDKLWLFGVKSTGAQSINLAFNDFYLPDGAKLFIYSADKKFVIGAFTSQNNDASKMFATDLLPGDAVILEYYEPAAVRNQGRLNLFRVTHGYRGVKDYALKSFGGAGTCEVNVNCPLGANWQDQKRGVVCLVVGGSEFCTGSLINDVPQDAKPYVLTANHCSTSNDMATWVFRFNWEAPGCTNPSSSPSTTQSLSTSTLRARNAGSDFCLVEITGGLSGGTVPASYTPYFNGWSNIDIPATSAIGIHHPAGDIKKISEAANATQSSTMSGATCWRVGVWTTACTEPGSSGSPLFDQNHRIVGQLYGGPSGCGVAAANNYDNYGKFAISWATGGTPSTELKDWLDAGNTGTTTVDGYDPNAVPPAFNVDAGIQSVNVPATGFSTCNSSIIPQLVIHNFGADTLKTCTVNYSVDGGANQIYNWTGSLNTNQGATITLPVMSGLSVASHTFASFTSNPNGNTEQNISNDGQTSSFIIFTPSPVVSAPQSENFETTFPSANFTVVNPDANETWLQTNTAGGFGASTSSAMIDNYSSTTSLEGQNDFIYLPYIDFTSAITPITLTFDVAYARYSATYSDSLEVNVTNDCGTNWATVYAKGGTNLATVAADNATALFVPAATEWRTETVNLNSYAGQSALKFAFKNISGWGQALYIDNINLTTGASSVNSNNFNSSFAIYPNPNNGVFNIKMNLQKTENVTIKVMNMLGEIILTKNILNASTGVYNIELADEAKGMYFVEVVTSNERSVKKITVLK